MFKDQNDRYFVLYADDDEDDVDLMLEAFSKYSMMSIITKNNGLDVISFLNEVGSGKELPCLVILDINMPRLDGKETLKRLRKNETFNDVPIVLFTTTASPIDASFAHELNAGYLTKPMDANQLEFIADHFIEFCSAEVRKNVFLK